MSLSVKIPLSIGTILLAVILVHTAVALRREANHTLALAQREADLVGAVAERAIARAMTDGRSEEVQAILAEIGRMPDLAAIRVVDHAGTVMRSNRPGESGGAVPRAPGDETGRTVEVSRPIPNRPACHRCHGPAQTTLGFLNVRFVLPSMESRIAEPWAGVFPAILALVVSGGLIALYFTLVIAHRIGSISRAMSRVEAGDLTARVPAGRHDELGHLGESFNAMVVRLAGAQRQLEARHADEIRRAEHLASLGKMAAGIAHEINNPLAGMQNCVRTLLRGARDGAQRVQYLELLRDGLGRIGRTVRQLLDFARESRPRLAPTALAPLLHRTLALVEQELAARKIACALSVDSGLPLVLADTHQLEQVLLNILMNAVEAMADGGSLTVAAGLRRRDEDTFVEIAVTDTGIGIPPEDLARVFDPFFTTKEVGRGTGLGLSISHGIVQAHGGFIEVRSAVGRGTTLVVVLPARAEGERDGTAGSPGGRRADPASDARKRPR